MIKIGKLLYIHYTTVMFFVVCWFTRRLELLFFSYLSVFLHELAHAFCAYLIGIEISYVAFFPFGVNLRIKSRIIYSISDEVLLYMSGPLFSAVFALLTGLLYPDFKYLYWNNIGLFLFNLLPILPMDGAMVLKRILSDKMGNSYAEKVLKRISAVLISVLVIFEIWLAYKNAFNFSVVFLVIFLTANVFTNNEKYSMSFVKELIYIKKKCEKDCVKVIPYLVNENYSDIRLAQNFVASKNYIVFKKNKKGRITEIMTEKDIIDKILNNK